MSAHNRCSRHPERAVVGVCASCLRERLAVAVVVVPRAAADVLQSQPQQQNPFGSNAARFSHLNKKTSLPSSSHEPKGEPPPPSQLQSIRRSRSFSEGRRDEEDEDQERKKTLSSLFSLDDSSDRPHFQVTALREEDEEEAEEESELDEEEEKIQQEPGLSSFSGSFIASSWISSLFQKKVVKKTEECLPIQDPTEMPDAARLDHGIIPRRSWEEGRLSWDEGRPSLWERPRRSSSSCDGTRLPWEPARPSWEIPPQTVATTEAPPPPPLLSNKEVSSNGVWAAFGDKQLVQKQQQQQQCSSYTHRAFTRHDIDNALLRSEIEGAMMRHKEMLVKLSALNRVGTLQQGRTGISFHQSIPVRTVDPKHSSLAGFAQRQQQQRQEEEELFSHNQLPPVPVPPNHELRGEAVRSKIWMRAFNPMKAFRQTPKPKEVPTIEVNEQNIPMPVPPPLPIDSTSQVAPQNLPSAAHKYSMWNAYCSPVQKDKNLLKRKEESLVDKSRVVSVSPTNVESGLLRFYLTPLRAGSSRHRARQIGGRGYNLWS